MKKIFSFIKSAGKKVKDAGEKGAKTVGSDVKKAAKKVKKEL